MLLRKERGGMMRFMLISLGSMSDMFRAGLPSSFSSFVSVPLVHNQHRFRVVLIQYLHWFIKLGMCFRQNSAMYMYRRAACGNSIINCIFSKRSHTRPLMLSWAQQHLKVKKVFIPTHKCTILRILIMAIQTSKVPGLWWSRYFLHPNPFLLPSRPTNLTPRSLWNDPKAAAKFLGLEVRIGSVRCLKGYNNNNRSSFLLRSFFQKDSEQLISKWNRLPSFLLRLSKC